MNAILVRKIEPAYLKKLKRYNLINAFFTAFFVLGSFFWMYKQIGSQQFNHDFANATYALSSFIGAGWALQTLYRGRHGPLRFTPRYQTAWLLISLGLISNGIGGLFYWYLERMGETYYPSIADLFFILYYPLFFVGFLLIPAQARFRIRMAIDAMITTCSILGISWFLLIGPQYFQQAPQATSLEKITNLAINLSYPTLDAISLLALFLLVQRKMETSFTIPYFLLILAQISTMWANGAYAYLSIFNRYETGNPYVDTFWFIGPLLCGMAGLCHYTALAREAQQQQKSEERSRARAEIVSLETVNNHWKTPSLHVYIPFVTLLLLSTYAEMFSNGPVTDYLIILTLFVSIIVAARYLLATRENEFLLQEREQQRRDSENLRMLATRLNRIMDMDRLIERIISLAIEELGFTMSMLIIAPRKEQASLAVHVSIASNTAPISTWYIHNNAFLRQTAQTGKEMELHWAQHMGMLAPEVQGWLQQQPYTSTHFIPLYFQNELLGCLGVASHRTQPLKQRSLILARAYSDEVAAIIKYTHLYEEAREHETFANAMATIAAKLNSAAIEQAEIGRLICQEGARALRADYVILYLLNDQNLLDPYALSINEVQKDSSLKNLSELRTLYDLKNWPQIYPHEYEAQTLQALEPHLHVIALPILPGSRPSGTKATRELPETVKIYHHPHFSTFHEKLMQLRVSTTLSTPLIVRDKAAGILVFARGEYGGTNEYPPFDVTDIPHARDFVAQARIAFTNARLYQHLKTTHKQLQELDQLKDQFMITASHELRTPLTAVQGYVELLTTFGEELTTKQYQEFLHKARQGCEELAVLLSNIMDASRLEVDMGLRPMYTTQVLVDDVIKSTLLIIEPQLTQEKREVHLHLPGDLAVRADPIRLRQILMNISVNALKYSDPPTSISFFAHANNETRQVLISIADKGKGIVRGEQARVFERFYRMENDINSPVRGSGLGLYVSKRLLEAMGGKIWIESRGIAGEGSTFHIQLPMA